MRKPYSPEKFWEYYESLPPELQEALFSKEISDKIKRIGKMYDLDLPKIGKISSLVGDVFLGLLHPDEFKEELEKELPEEKQYIKEIAHDVWRLILFPLKDALSQIYEIKEKKVFKEVPKIEVEEKEKIKEEKALEEKALPKKEKEEEIKFFE